MLNLKKYLNLTSPKNVLHLLWFSGALLFLALFSALTVNLLELKNFETIDIPILEFIGRNIRTPFLNGAAVDVTALGSVSIISLICTMTLVALLINKDRIGALFLLLNVIGGTLWMTLLKNFIARPRPLVLPHLVEVEGLSYPSGHSLVSTVTYLSIAFLIGRHVKSKINLFIILFFSLLIILLVGASRMYLGVHYPSDVISGILFGISWVLFLTWVFKALSYRNSLR